MCLLSFEAIKYLASDKILKEKIYRRAFRSWQTTLKLNYTEYAAEKETGFLKKMK